MSAPPSGGAPAPASPPPASTTAPPPSTPPPATPPPAATPPSSPPPPPTAPTPSPPPPPPPTAPAPSPPSPPPPVTPSPPPPVSPAPSTPPPVTPSPSPPTSSPPPPPSVAPKPSPTSSPPPPVTPATPSPPPPASSRSPPPPAVSKSPPPPPSPSSGTTSPPPSSSSSSSTGIVVAAVVGGVVVLVVLVVALVCSRKKRRRESGSPPPPPSHGHKDDPYGHQLQYWQQNAPPPPNHMMQMMPKPTPQPPIASSSSISSAYEPKPPPLPPFMSSSGEYGSNYSGSQNPYPSPSPGMALGFSKSTFTFEELKMATNGFSDANLLGQGGFGYVHKGVLPNGKEVAVKQLKAGSGQGEREFQAEVEIISRVHHRHLVSLVGYCITGSHRLLVYEFVPNGTLQFHLHGEDRPAMDWRTRLKIALGSAKGLAYLHEDCYPKIIHRDIKAANILVDYSFEAKVADFGLAKFTSDVNTHVSTRVMGTFGYLAPEYASSGKLTEKSDVFSYGVMLLELITGRKPIDATNTYMDESLVDWARPQLSRALDDQNFDSLVDPNLEKNYNHSEMIRMVSCAAACVRHSARRRPKMSQIVHALEGDMSLSDLNEGMPPRQGSLYSSHGSSEYDTRQYNEDLKIFRRMAFGNQEYGSSEYSGSTGEYGASGSGNASSGQNTKEMEMGKTKKDSRGFSGGS